MDVNLVLSQLVVGAILGMAGQTIRMVAGLKKVLDEASAEGVSFKDKFSTSVLVVSLLLGAVAGLLAMVAVMGGDAKSLTKETIMGVMAAGSVGADCIEAFMKKAGTPIKSGTFPMTAATVAFVRRRKVSASKPIAVADAVKAQLEEDGRPSDKPDKVMGADLKYSIDSIRNFLSRVRVRLYDGSPRYFFQFDGAFAKAALGQSVADLIGAIDNNTSTTQPADWENP
jgi:hypothetical protein